MPAGRPALPVALALGAMLVAATTAGCASARPATNGQAEDPSEARFAIARAIVDNARAVTTFPTTTDPQAVLRFYAPEYDGIQDGDRQTLADVRRLLDDLGDRISAGAPIELLARTTNIRVDLIDATTGWATYDLFFAIGAAGRVAFRQQARCSGLYRKTGDAWLIRHEHCSTQRAERP